ncbi:MAG TPA: LTA synthase family protein [Lachnospiraceae bacterium]|nr:LTA synthase family protein [Lachnospiraceae bacterium]
MIWIFAYFVGSFLFMELVYHFSGFGFAVFNPMLSVALACFLAGISTVLTGFMKKKVNRIIFWIFLAFDYVLFASQLVYMKIFKQPLLIAAITNTGKAAVTNYWREALYAILKASGWLLLLAVPLIAAGILLKVKKLVLKSHSIKERVGGILLSSAGLLCYIAILAGGFLFSTDYFEEYSGFYDPEGIITEYGVSASLVRDVLGDAFPEEREVAVTAVNGPVYPEETQTIPTEETLTVTEPEEPEVDTSPNVLPVDFESLIANSDSDSIIELVEYMQSMTPTNRNEYTGMFEGYNLIYLTAEGFCSYAVDEKLTPTLYKLIHSGFVVEDYYVPLWQTSTSDGEYVNCTGLIPDQQFSFKRSADDDMVFSLPAFFSKESVKSYAYHNNSLSYYSRNLTHPNLGYNFKACKLGDLSESDWGGQVFEMDHVNYWPASDLDMMKATIPEYIGEDRFHVYYMTVSGHMNYNFTGNKMSSLHKDAVADLPYSEEGRAYIACNMELDLALQYLIEQLEAAGKLEKTVICLSADHYPYAMDVANLDELAGTKISDNLDTYKNSLILWNSEMETVTVDKTASSLDIVPTLLNLFGFDYDSRLYVGRDILSDSTPLVIFSDRSFITDEVSYYKKGKQTTWRDGVEEDEAYFEAIKNQVKGLYKYAAGILINDFYQYVEEALPEEYHSRIDLEWVAPHAPKPKESTTESTETDTTTTNAVNGDSKNE